jgi:glycosyltransferase involved in cell wall biosynthesis
LHWYPNYLGGGGVATAVAGLANGQSRVGLKVAIAAAELQGSTLYGSMVECLAPEVDLIRWQPRWTLKWGNMLLRGLRAKDRRALVAWHPDVVHIHGEFNPDNLRVPRVFDCPIVLSPHGAFHPVVFAKSKRLAKRLYVALATPLLYQKAVFHALTPYSFERGHDHVPSSDWYIAPNGPSLTLEPFQATLRRRRRNPSDPVRFLYVGRLHVHTKGLDLVLEALASIVRRSLDRGCRLTLVGPDWDHGRAELEAMVNALGITPWVEFAGVKIGKELAAAYQDSDVYIQCSRHEGQSLAATDALLFGMPAILTDTIALCSYPEVRNASHVLVVPPRAGEIAAAMVKAVEEFEDLLARADQERAKLHARFSWDAVARAHVEQYNKIVSEAAGAGRA